MPGVAAKGTNWRKRQANLFLVTALHTSDGVVTSPDAVANCVKMKFERRWQAMPDDLEPVFTSSDIPLSALSLDAEDVCFAAKKLKRPWIRDCRGIPPAALFASMSFVQAVLPFLSSLLCLDTD